MESLSRASLLTFGEVAGIDQKPRQRVGVELDHPAAVRSHPHEHIRNDRRHLFGAEGQPRLGIEFADLRDHVGDIFGIDAAMRGQPGQIAAGHQVQAGEKPGHGGIQPVLGFELQPQAFGQIARAHPHRIETLQHAQHRLDILDLGAEPIGDLAQFGAQIARLVDAVDQSE